MGHPHSRRLIGPGLSRPFYNWRPMKLLLKFNLVLILVFAVGIGIAGYFSREFLERNAQDQVLQQPRLMMGAAGGMRDLYVAADRAAAGGASGARPDIFAADGAGVFGDGSF